MRSRSPASSRSPCSPTRLRSATSTKDGNYAGYDVYFAERLGKDLGVDVEYTSVDAAARVDVLTSNKVDITLANFTVTDERKEKVDFASRT